MQRRTILKALTSGLVCTPLLAGTSDRRPQVRRKGSTKKLLVIFQRGGSDSLNTLVPVDATQHNLYQGLRPTLAIPTSSLLSIPGNSFFGLHPAMSSLSTQLSGGKLSMIHAVGYPNSDRSHFESQSYYETGVPGNSLLDGWINRYLANTTGSGADIRGIGIGWSIVQSIQGDVAVPVSQNFGLQEIGVDDSLSNVNQDAYRQKLNDLIALTPSSGNEGIYDTGNKIFSMIASFSNRDLSTYAPENGANYPVGDFGDAIKHSAQMLKDTPTSLGIEVCVIDQAGYDTHAGQITAGSPTTVASGQGQLLKELADGMHAFYTDMGDSRMSDTLVLVVSEFGRRAYENDSLGTDHGTGSLAMIMHNGVSGQFYNGSGSWPGLASNQLKDGGDLDWVTDFRDIYWEILSRHMGVDNGALGQIIPGHSFSPLNFLS